jgi:gluconate 5-dehydrogenase
MKTTFDSRTNADWLDLAGRRVLIAGAGGVGAACALGFARAGCRTLVVDRDAAALDELTADAEFSASGGQTLVADLSLPGSGERAVAAAVELFGGLDVLLHCVGINDRRPILEIDESDWDRIIATNLSSAFGLARAAGRHMVANLSGRVIVLSSVSGLLAHRNHGAYAASKGGLNQLMRVMAVEWAASGVTVNAIAPGVHGDCVDSRSPGLDGDARRAARTDSRWSIRNGG